MANIDAFKTPWTWIPGYGFAFGDHHGVRKRLFGVQEGIEKRHRGKWQDSPRQNVLARGHSIILAKIRGPLSVAVIVFSQQQGYHTRGDVHPYARLRLSKKGTESLNERQRLFRVILLGVALILFLFFGSCAIDPMSVGAVRMPLSEKRSTLPQGDNGIAARYPGDEGIEQDPAVVFHDDFESGNLSKWTPGWRFKTLGSHKRLPTQGAGQCNGQSKLPGGTTEAT
jgi:hypothetical protein